MRCRLRPVDGVSGLVHLARLDFFLDIFLKLALARNVRTRVKDGSRRPDFFLDIFLEAQIAPGRNVRTRQKYGSRRRVLFLELFWKAQLAPGPNVQDKAKGWVSETGPFSQQFF